MLRLPNLADHVPAANSDIDRYTGIGQKIIFGIEKDVERPSILANELLRIAVAPQESDGNQGQTEFAGSLNVISGQNAKTAGINAKLRRQAVLHAKIGHPWE